MQTRWKLETKCMWEHVCLFHLTIDDHLKLPFPSLLSSCIGPNNSPYACQAFFGNFSPFPVSDTFPFSVLSLPEITAVRRVKKDFIARLNALCPPLPCEVHAVPSWQPRTTRSAAEG